MAWSLGPDGKPVWVPDAAANTAPVTLVNTETGQLEEVAADMAGAYLGGGGYAPASEEDIAAHNARVATTERTRLGDIAGDVVGDVGNLGAAQARGFADVVLSPARAAELLLTGENRYIGSGGQLLSEAAGIGSELTGGEGLVTERETAEAQRKYAEEHPLLSGLAYGSGAALALGAGGYSGAASKLGAAAKGATGVRAIELGVAGAAEGAVLGAAEASDRAFIEDVDLTAEKWLSSVGINALLGGGAGAGLGGLGDAASAIRGRVKAPRAVAEAAEAAEAAGATTPGTGTKPGWIEDTARKFRDERVIKALGARGTDVRKLGRSAEEIEQRISAIGKDVFEHKLSDGKRVFSGRTEEVGERVIQARQEVGSALGKLRKEVSDYLQSTAQKVEAPGVVKGRGAAAVPATQLRPGLGVDTKALAGRIHELSAEYAANAHGPTAAMGRRTAEVADEIRKLGSAPSLEDLARYRRALDEEIWVPSPPGLPKQPGPNAEALTKARGIIEEHIEAATERAAAEMGEGVAKEYRTLKAKYRSFAQAASIVEKAVPQDLGNRVVSPSDYIVGAAALAGDIAGGAGIFSTVKGAAAAAGHKLLREESSAILAKVANAIAQRVDDKVAHSVGKLVGRSVPELEDRPIRELLRSREAKEAALPTSLALFLGGHETKANAYKVRAQELYDATDRMGGGVRQRMQERMSDIGDANPTFYAAVAGRATTAAEFLKSKLPAPLINVQSLTPRASAAMPSDLEIAQFARYWSAVEDPMSIFADLEKGMATHEQIEALGAVYPRILRQVQLEALSALRERDTEGEPVPYESRKQLDALLGLGGAGDPLLTTDFAVRWAELSASRAEQQQTQPRPQQVAPRIGERLRTHSEQLDAES